MTPATILTMSNGKGRLLTIPASASGYDNAGDRRPELAAQGGAL